MRLGSALLQAPRCLKLALRVFDPALPVVAEVPISTNEGFDYKHLYFIALHDFQVASF